MIAATLDIAAVRADAWWPAGAVLALDFAGGRGVLAGAPVAVEQLLTTVRDGPGAVTDSDGTVRNFPPHAPRIGDRGLLVEAGPPLDNVQIAAQPWYSSAAGTWLIELGPRVPSGDFVSVLGLSSSAGSKYWFGLGFGRPYLDGSNAGAYTGALHHAGALPLGGGSVAFAYGGGGLALGVGGAAETLATAVPPPAVAAISLGTEFGTVAPLGGFVRRLVWWPRTFTPAELAALTA